MYLQHHGGYDHSANMTINIDFVTPNLFEHELHAISWMKQLLFARSPYFESVVHFLSETLMIIRSPKEILDMYSPTEL